MRTASVSDSYTAGAPLTLPTGTVGASISQNIFDNFKGDADIEAARALTEASRYALQNSEQNVLLAVVQAYMGVIQNTQLVQLDQENVKFYQAQVDSANDRLKIGEGTKIDVSQAQARLAQGTAAYEAAIVGAADEPGKLRALCRAQAAQSDRHVQPRQPAAQERRRGGQ